MKFKNLAKIRPSENEDLVLFINDNSELSVISAVFENGSILVKNLYDDAHEGWLQVISMDDILHLERNGHINGIEIYWTEFSEFEKDADVSDDITYELLAKQNVE